MTLLFVYGTLKRGGENHEWLAGQRFITAARTKPLYRMFDLGGYPGLVRSAAGLSALARLDVLEDVEGGEYERVEIELAGGHPVQAVEGYLCLRDITGRNDLGTCW